MTVDLSLYLNKHVEVTYRNGETDGVTIERNNSGAYERSHPYIISETGFTYTKSGKFLPSGYVDDDDIIKVRLIGGTKYAHLEEQVAELQAEIERLKKEENTLAEYDGWKFVKMSDTHVKIQGASGQNLCAIPTETLMGLARQLTSS